tara:strand:- start:4725 stop:5567 length:843 start_codon:yes stop_codon:yes gene_type:complete
MAQAATELQRSRGELRVQLRRLGDRTSLAQLYQEGCLRARLPQHSSAAPLEIVTINTAGGLTDGDDVNTTIHWNAASRGIVTTQAAERIYHCRDAPAHITTTLVVDDNAIAAWLPQETILFDRSQLERNTIIELGNDTEFFGVESLVFGRIAMQELVRYGKVFDRLRLYQDGKLLFADALALGTTDLHAIDTEINQPGVLGSARCCATALYVGTWDGSLLTELRAIIEASGARGGASDLGNVIAIRLVGEDSRTLRHVILQLYDACLGHAGFSEPRVWNC